MTNPSIFAQNRHARTAIMLWLVMVLLSLGIISRSHFTADLSAFLPSHPTAEQQLLMDQLKDGLASRLILVGIEGADPQTRATLSKTIAQKLRVNPAFVSVNNGEEITAERDREYLFKNRYLLSPAVTPEHFSTDGLRTSISDSIDQIASPAGLLTKSLLPHDPTGEMLQLIDALSGSNRPDMFEGAWTSRDGNTALLLLQTSAAGSDTDAQKLAMQAIRAEFDQALNIDPAIVKPTLLMTGPGVFSVIARDTIKMQVRAIFIVSSVLIALLLWAVYRSMTALLLGFLPVATGILAGIASVSLAFGVVHGITLGFGTALIGEAVDYSIYLFMQTAQTGNREQNRKKWVATVWPTVRLGVLTSVFGFASLLMSGFPGLAQLGLYSVAGLITAAAMTRYVLPFLLPANFNIKDFSNSGERLVRYAKSASILRWPAILLVVISGFIVYNHHDSLWNTELSALSPVSAADQALDARLRGGMGAPDVRYVIVVSGDSQETVLRHTEQISLTLQGLVDKGVLAGFDTASHYLPSQATQQARLNSLPDSAELKSRLNTAVKGLPIKAALLEPFLQDVQSQRAIRLLQRTDLQGSSMAMALDAMLLQQGQHWSSLIPLTMPVGNDIDAVQVRKALSEVNIPNALFVDMKAESNRLYSSYMQEAILLSLAGVLAIIGLLLIALRSIKQLVAIIIPLVAAVLTVMAGLSLVGQQLIILHLIGLLLIVAIGSNYALFFNPNATSGKQAISSQTYASLVFANIATVLGFGLLAFSTVPVLQAMGVTVAPGVILALIFSAVFARKAGP
ncbi:MAG TPA: MMPL family transporter [Methylophilus sp.]|uniref:MMPL family transporter n=1 Tax=Methylophilus sp. TaxID=29541 RepID=UPI002B86F68C|nr:MMPL family transporter [Methylophilus sp.]HSH86801.1 MMPL family transporter [Methylophilus sp.]